MRQILNNFLATLRRYKVSSALNIAGLGVAFASLYFIAVQLRHDFTFNQGVSDYQQIYRIEKPDTWEDNGLYESIMPRPQSEAVGQELPQVLSYSLINGLYNGGDVRLSKNGVEIKIDDNLHTATNGVVELLDMKILEGSTTEFELENSLAVLISQSLAKKYNMGLGDTIKDGESIEKSDEYTVVAIFEDMAPRGTFSNLNFITKMGDSGLTETNSSFCEYYYKMRKDINLEETTATANQIYAAAAKQFAGKGETTEDNYNIRFQPLKDIYFAEGMSDPTEGNWGTVYTLIAIAAVILVIAFVNFINFFFALVPFRIRAVNARKIFGCSRAELIANFIFEALGLFVCAFALALYIIVAMQDGFIGEYVSASVFILDNVDIVTSLALFGALASIVIATYPALYITSFPAAMVIKSGFAASRAGKVLRFSLIGIQFVSSMVLFICAILMQSQYHYMLNFDIGIDTKNVISTVIPRTISQNVTLRDDFIEKLKVHDGIVDATFLSNTLPSEGGSRSRKMVNSVVYETVFLTGMANTLEFFGIDMVSGDGLITDGEINASKAFVINETAEKKYGEDEQFLELASRDMTFMGVCKDFNFQTLKKTNEPLTLSFDANVRWFLPHILYFRTADGADPLEVENHVKSAVEEMVPDCYTDYLTFESQEESIAQMYGDERKQSRLILLFTVISIIISLMGVFGLVLFETQFRQQEIVIRRVHGATVGEILMMINRKFLVIIAICFVVAAPVSYAVVSRWLSTFAYHISISAWVFVAVLAVVTLVTTSIVTVQSLKAANSNPADLIGKNS
ncbi:MAG: FtsX-like permease family protein [Rikenellaceae bacterium]